MEKITCKNCNKENSAGFKYCTQCGFELPKQEPIVVSTPEKNEQKKSFLNITNKGKNFIGMMFGILAFTASSYLVKHFFFNHSINAAMSEAASEVNKTCPMMVDAYTRLDNAIALPDNTFQYNYTLVNTEKSEVNFDLVKKNIEPSIINNVKTNPEMKTLRENKTTFIYYYKDKNGVFVSKITVTPDMYN